MRWRFAACGIIFAAGFLAACGGAPHHKTSTPTITQPKPPAQNVSLPWPTYGADNGRTRSVTVHGLRRPFRKLWTFHGHALLEFPPVAGYGLLYEENFKGWIYAIDPATGHVRWSYDPHFCGWSSPALGDGLVFATFIGDSRCSPHSDGGEIVALSARTGKVRWQHAIDQSESSPLFAHGSVYFGDTNGRVYAFNALTGTERWSYETGAPVKGSPALEHGRLFVGNYGGNFYALSARTGQVIWQNGGHGHFYAGASVIDGHVYIGCVDGRVYAFSARDGSPLWNFGTGAYVYSSTAVWRGIVLVGSYDQNFYAINGTTGTMRWSFPAGGKITGPASVINGIVYFSTESRKTYALDAATGRKVGEWNDGEYSAAVAADGRLYLIGYGQIHALAPRRFARR